MNDLISKIAGELGIGEAQAKGATGLLMKIAREKLAAKDYDGVSEAVGGADDLIDAAPEEGMGSFLFGGLAAAVSGSAGKELAHITTVVEGFKKLDIDPKLVAKVVTMVLDYIKSKGGDHLKEALAKVFDV